MKLTTRGRFAVNAMVHLALYATDKPISLPQISEKQQISVAYLEQIFYKLRRAGLVVSVRGPGGGYFLGRDATSISVSDVIAAVEENIDVTLCRGEGTCLSGSACLTHHLWENLNVLMKDYLDNVTLGAIVDSLEKHQHPHHPAHTSHVVHVDQVS